MAVWMTSDLHIGHANIIEYCNRPFDDVPHMNEILVRNWNERVSPDDTVWCLGDMVMGRRDETLPILGRLNGTKILVAGNHDNNWVHNPKREKWIPLYAPYFADVMEETTLEIAGQTVKLHHFPYVGDSHEEDRYAEHRPLDEGGWLLHGHVHDSFKIRDRMVNVGVDVWDYAPVALETIASIIRGDA